MSFKISWKMHLLCALMALGICFVLYDLLTKLSFDFLMEINITGNILVDYLIFITAIFIPITVVHEALHGIAYITFGGKVKFGFKIIYAYAQEISGIILNRTQFLIVLMAPVIIISVITTLIQNDISKMIFALNLMGSTGDLVMAFYLCKGHENSCIVDKSYGFDMVDI